MGLRHTLEEEGRCRLRRRLLRAFIHHGGISSFGSRHDDSQISSEAARKSTTELTKSTEQYATYRAGPIIFPL